MKPPFLHGLSVKEASARAQTELVNFKGTNAYQLLMWWLSELRDDARGIYLHPNTRKNHRLMAIGQDQVIQALLQKLQEVLAFDPDAPTGGEVVADDSDSVVVDPELA